MIPKKTLKLLTNSFWMKYAGLPTLLGKIGVNKGDRVCLYMQMVPQLPVAMLACARIGAVHNVVFGAFSPDSLSERIQRFSL